MEGSDKFRMILIAARVTVLTILVTGILYPLAMTGLSQLLFPHEARGSLVRDDHGRVLGSALIGQRFTSAAYFHPRPSAAGEAGYDAAASSGSNLGPTAKKLRQRVEAEIARLRRDNPNQRAPIPADLVTTSASGLDPHLSPVSVSWQIPRVALSRGVTTERISALVAEHTEGRELGFLGEPRVNVLLLNLALDQRFGRPGLDR